MKFKGNKITLVIQHLHDSCFEISGFSSVPVEVLQRELTACRTSVLVVALALGDVSTSEHVRGSVAQSVSDWEFMSINFPFSWGSIHEGIRTDKCCAECVRLGVREH